MSDKRPDERDIDEILASIDEMLSQKQPYILEENSRKDAVKEGIKASEDKLGLSSSVDMPELFGFDKVEIEDFLSLGIQGESAKDTNIITDNVGKEGTREEVVEPKNNSVSKTNSAQNINVETSYLTDEDINFTLDDIDIPDFHETQNSNQAFNANKEIAETPESKEGNVDGIELSSTKPQETETKNTDHNVANHNVANHKLAESITNEAPIEEDLLKKSLLDDQVGDEHQHEESTEDYSDSTPRHRILLTEELLEPSAKEALPLWIEQAESESSTANAHASTNDKCTPLQEVASPSIESVQTKVSPTEASPPTSQTTLIADKPEKAANPEPKTETSSVSSKPLQRSQSEQEAQNIASHDVSSEEHKEKSSLDASQGQRDTEETSNKTNDDTIFDLDEDIGMDTVYKLETLPVRLSDDLDDHTELVEVMMEKVLQQNDEQPQDTEVEHESESEKVFLSDDELQHMAQAVSADVSQQINDHLQTWLPGLISIAIKNHLKDINNNDKT
ncbi:MAG: hypothetical protein Q9N02_01750 [Ghiorsea sp.]|nr:hypothetical protein [Ghiorsea sp.]